ncbi:MAG: hypothetical protein U5N85_12685 [Arcicella sp.]|nr:hypothetical protein [Arcicella sp.]
MNHETVDTFESSIYENINFISRYKKLYAKYNNWDNRISKIDKKEVSSILETYNYPFKYVDSTYYCKESIESYTFHIAIQVKGGIPILTFNIEKDNVFYPLTGHNLTRAYKLLLNLETALIVTFIDYEQLNEIMKEYLRIYEDFKIEFLNQVKVI